MHKKYNIPIPNEKVIKSDGYTKFSRSEPPGGTITHSKSKSVLSDNSIWGGYIVLVALLALSLVACSSKKQPTPRFDENNQKKLKSSDLFLKASKQKLKPEEAKGLLGEMVDSWVYGEGIGKTTLTVGTIALFPPYGIYVLANSLLELSGMDSYRVTELLPEEDKEDFDFFYSTVTSAPGRFAASIAGKEFRSEEVVKERIKPYIKDDLDGIPITNGTVTKRSLRH